MTAVALSAELGLAASGAADGTVLLHTCHNGALLRRLTHPDGQPVGHLLVNALHCRLVVGAATAGEGRLYLFSLSGVRLHCLQLPGGVRTVLLSPDGALLLAGGVSGALIGWRLDDGALACTFDGAGAAVSCACISGHEMLVGTQEGDVVGYALDPAVLYGRSVRDVAAWAYSPIERKPVRIRLFLRWRFPFSLGRLTKLNPRQL